ncbi:hypothetical protein LB505_001088 [Fusarium chuoi]|nr:hypothetical protein LB505_001088 [Fusarium chuoi]
MAMAVRHLQLGTFKIQQISRRSMSNSSAFPSLAQTLRDRRLPTPMLPSLIRANALFLCLISEQI